MATAEEPEIFACSWCRAAMHNRCEKKWNIQSQCQCDCDRGY